MNNAPQKPRRKRSRNVTLISVAGGAMAVGLSGCGSATWQRNVYSSFEACAADYGPSVCQRLGRTEEARVLGPVYRLRNGRPSSCQADDQGPGSGWFGQQRKPDTLRVMRGETGTHCRRVSSTSSGNRYWGSSPSSSRRDGIVSGPSSGGGSIAAPGSGGVTRNVFGSRGVSSSGG